MRMKSIHRLATRWQPLIAVDEQFSHGQRRRSLLTEDLEPPYILRRERIFHVEGPVLLHCPAQLDGLVGRRPLVNVVNQADIESELRAYRFEHADGGGQVTAGIKYRRRGHAIRPQSLHGGGGLGAAHAVTGPSGNCQLHAHHLVAFLDVGLHLVVQLTLRQGGGVAIERHCRANLASQQLIDRHAETLAQDVPQRAIDSAQRVVAFRPGAEIFLQVRRLPDVFDLVAVFADHKRLQPLFNVGLRRLGNFLVGRRAQSVEPGLAGLHLDDGPVGAGGRGGNDFDVGDFQRRHSLAGRFFGLRQRTSVAHGLDDAGSRFGREGASAGQGW